jgi:hypothetical protein
MMTGLGGLVAVAVAQCVLPGHMPGLSDIELSAVRNPAALGGVVILPQPAEAHVKLVDAAARVRLLGRAGEGPGEFRNPVAAGWVDGMTWVYDAALRRLSYFSEEGTFIRSHSSSWPGAFPLASGKLLLHSFSMQPDGSGTEVLAVQRIPSRVDTIGTYTVRSRSISVRGAGLVRTVQDPWSQHPRWGITPDGSSFYVAEPVPARSGTFLLRRFDSEGREVWQRSFSFAPRPITRADVRSLAEEWSIRLRQQAQRLARLEPQDFSAAVIMRELQPPAHAPVVGRLVAAASGQVWIHLVTAEASETDNHWLVIDPDGSRAAECTLPRDSWLAGVDAANVWMIRRDEFDASVLQRFVRAGTGRL